MERTIQELKEEACFWASFKMVGLYDALESKNISYILNSKKEAAFLFNEANSLSEKSLAKAGSEDECAFVDGKIFTSYEEAACYFAIQACEYKEIELGLTKRLFELKTSPLQG